MYNVRKVTSGMKTIKYVEISRENRVERNTDLIRL